MEILLQGIAEHVRHCREFPGIARHCEICKGITMHCKEILHNLNEILRGFFGILCNLMELQGIAGYARHCKAFPWDYNALQGITRTSFPMNVKGGFLKTPCDMLGKSCCKALQGMQSIAKQDRAYHGNPSESQWNLKGDS